MCVHSRQDMEECRRDRMRAGLDAVFLMATTPQGDFIAWPAQYRDTHAVQDLDRRLTDDWHGDKKDWTVDYSEVNTARMMLGLPPIQAESQTIVPGDVGDIGNIIGDPSEAEDPEDEDDDDDIEDDLEQEEDDEDEESLEKAMGQLMPTSIAEQREEAHA